MRPIGTLIDKADPLGGLDRKPEPASEPKAPVLTRDKDHVYRLDGVFIPGVTQVIREAGLINTDWFTEMSRLRGTAFHICAQYLDEGDLDESSVDPVVKPYLDSYKEWKADSRFQPATIEEMRYHKFQRYAGTIDRTGVIQTSKREKQIICDFKTGEPHPSHKIQLAGYAYMLPEPHRFVRLSIYLSSEGKRARVVEHPLVELGEDSQEFFCALSTCNWKRRHKLS